MISSADFTRSLLGRCTVARAVNPRRGRPPGAPGGAAYSCWGGLMAAAGEVSWPPAGSFLAAYGEVLMAADTGRGAVGQGARHRTSAHGEAGTRLTPSLPWIGALPPCSPAKMQAGSLHSSVSYGASFGSHVTIRPMGLTREAGRVLCGLSSTNGHCRGTCAAEGSRTFALDSRAVVPHLHHDPRGDLVGQYPGGGRGLPRPPPPRGVGRVVAAGI